MTNEETPIALGAFGFNPDTGELWRDGKVQRLRPQASQALKTLVERPGQMVSRRELQLAIWPDTKVEYDLSLNVCIRQLRMAFGDDADAPEYIQTLPRRGYRFVAPVHKRRTLEEKTPRRPRTAVWALVVAVVVTVVISVWPREPAGTTVAFLPLRFIPPMDSLQYLEDGLSEEMITLLARVAPNRLTVIAPTSSFAVAARGVGPAEAGAALGADFVLQGAVRPVDTGFRVTVQLVETATGAFRWSDSYDLNAEELLSLDHTIALPIAGALSFALGTPIDSGLDRPLPANKAREAVLRARFVLARFTRTDAQRAIEFIQRGMTQDSTSPELYVELARAHLQLGNIDSAEAAIAEARRLDPGGSGIDKVEGEIALFGRSDGDDAVAFLTRAVARAPGAGEQHRLLANALVSVGRVRDAAVHGRRALAIDPVSSTVRGDVGWVFYYARRFDEAIEVCGAMLELTPESMSARQCIVFASALDGSLGSAATIVSEVLEMLGAGAVEQSSIVEGLSPERSHSLWRWLVATPDRRARIGRVSEARVWALLNEPAKAAAILHETSRSNRRSLLFVEADPAFDAVRKEPDFRSAVEITRDRR